MLMTGPAMSCRRVSSGHWAGVLALVLGLCLSVAGVVSPWWRTLQDPLCSHFEGLWQQCSRCWHSRTRCSFSDRHAGPWRALQALQLLSLLCLALSLVLAVTCASKRRCQRGRCPIPALAALIGGLTGLLADLLFVGYIERYVPHAPQEHLYAWSFALAVTGALLSLLAALLFSLAKALCPPRFTTQSVQPYWPYNHCTSLGQDPHPPHDLPPYYSGPCPYPTIPEEPSAGRQLSVEGQEALKERQRLYEQYRQGRVLLSTEEGKGLCGCPGRLEFNYEKESVKETPNGENKASVASVVQPPAYSEVQEGNTERNNEGQKLNNEEQTKDESAPRVINKPEDKDARLNNEAQTPGSPVMVLTLNTADQPGHGQFQKSSKTPVFTVERSVRELRDIRVSKGENPRQQDGDEPDY